MDNKLEQAQALYEQQDYKGAFDAAHKAASSEASVPACLLMAKSFLNQLNGPYNDSANDTFYTAVRTALNVASNIEEVWFIEQDICEAMRVWSEKVHRYFLDLMIENPDELYFKKVTEVHLKIIEMSIPVTVMTRNCSLAKKFMEENGLTEQGAYAKFLDKQLGECDAYISNEQAAAMEIEAVSRMFENAKAACEDISHASTEYINAHRKDILMTLLRASILANFAARKKRIPTELAYQGYYLRASILTYMLATVIYPNGRPMSLFTGDRQHYINELSKTHQDLKRLDPSFQIPPLPTVEAIMPAASSSGCYVATAVYGSYNCPQVWTLRRFRDNTLAETWYGRAFIRAYYAVSPTLVKWFGQTKWFRNLWKPALDRMVEKLNIKGVENTPYNDRIW